MNRKNLLCAMWFISGLVFSCQRDLNTACPPIQKITVQTGCYDQQTGLALKAVGNFDSIATVILWKFYIGKDSTVGLSPSALRIFQGRKSIKLPDSLLTNQQVVNVNAQFNCNGKMYDSYYYSFVKESAGGCVRWVLHNP